MDIGALHWQARSPMVGLFRHESGTYVKFTPTGAEMFSLMADKGWQRRFDDPIPLPGGRQLVTLRDAALYITKLPKAEHDAPEWQAAMQALIMVAEHDGPTMLARVGMMRALHRHEPKAAPEVRRKRAKAYKIAR